MHVCVGMSLRLDQFPVKSLLEWAIEVTAKVAKLRIKFFYLQIRNIYTHTQRWYKAKSWLPTLKNTIWGWGNDWCKS